MGGGRIIDVVDEILSQDENAGGLAIKWYLFGSNGEEKADYSRGLLERFTRRERDRPALIKTIANPRKIDYKRDAHIQNYFEGFYSIDENRDIAKGRWCNKEDIFAQKKIVIHHYYTKSREEYLNKLLRGPADGYKGYEIDRFNYYDRNDEFDDSILKYRDERAKVYQPPKPRSADDLIKALERNLSPTLSPDTPPEFYAGKMEIFLTCRAVAAYLQTKLADDTQAKFFEEASLKAIIEALKNSPSEADKSLLKLELPKILELPYPIVENFRKM